MKTASEKLLEELDLWRNTEKNRKEYGGNAKGFLVELKKNSGMNSWKKGGISPEAFQKEIPEVNPRHRRKTLEQFLEEFLEEIP